MDGADPTGCARLIDGALRPGPSSWLRRVPIAEPLQFHHETDYATALALDLLVRPRAVAEGRSHCRHCAAASPPRDDDMGDDGRHFVTCPGRRLGRSQASWLGCGLTRGVSHEQQRL